MGDEKSALDLVLAFQTALNEETAWPLFLSQFKTFLKLGDPEVGAGVALLGKDGALQFHCALDICDKLNDRLIDMCRLHLALTDYGFPSLGDTFPTGTDRLIALSIESGEVLVNFDSGSLSRTAQKNELYPKSQASLLIFKLSVGCTFLFFTENSSIDLLQTFMPGCHRVGHALKQFYENYQKYKPVSHSLALWEPIFYHFPLPACLIDNTLKVWAKNSSFLNVLGPSCPVELDAQDGLVILEPTLHQDLLEYMADDPGIEAIPDVWIGSHRRGITVIRFRVQRLSGRYKMTSGSQSCVGVLTFEKFKTANIEQFLEFGLTKAEMEVVTEICLGSSNAEIAAGRNKSTDTINSQVKSILRKTGVKKRAELILMASNEVWHC